MAKKLFVGNLPFSSTEQEVQELFAEYGEVLSVNLINDRETGRPRGFGFVEMDEAAADQAMEALGDTELGGRRLRVDVAHDRPKRDSRPPRQPHQPRW